MSIADLGEVIAEREFDSLSEGGPPVVGRLGKPRPDTRDGGDWQCSYQVLGTGDDTASTAYGVDSLQALMLAIDKLRADLTWRARQREEGFSWFGQPGLGFD
jgi:hypothetical protein